MRSPAGDHGLGPPRLPAGCLQSPGIGLEIGEAEGIAARHVPVRLLEGTGVGEQFDVAVRRDAEVVPALGTNAEVSREALPVQDFPAAVALSKTSDGRSRRSSAVRRFFFFWNQAKAGSLACVGVRPGSGILAGQRHGYRRRRPRHQEE